MPLDRRHVLAESRLRRKSHVRFGRPGRRTHRRKRPQGASGQSHWFAAGLTVVRRNGQRRELAGSAPEFEPERLRVRFALLRRADTLDKAARARLEQLFVAHVAAPPCSISVGSTSRGPRGCAPRPRPVLRPHDTGQGDGRVPHPLL